VWPYCDRRRSSVWVCENTIVFWHQIELNWLWWSPSGVLLDYMWSPALVLRDWIRSPGKVSILMEYTWSLIGFFNNVKGYYLERVQMDSTWTPDGVHQDAWLSVTTSHPYLSKSPMYMDWHHFAHIALAGAWRWSMPSSRVWCGKVPVSECLDGWIYLVHLSFICSEDHCTVWTQTRWILTHFGAETCHSEDVVCIG
jgi:hypothetical protein